MNKTQKIFLMIVAILLVFNGLMNIVDDGRVLTYDIASILSGIGFFIIYFQKNK